MDVFGYPLNPLHFGTTENALLEAMAAGVPPVCLKHCTEKHILRDGETGLLVNNAEEYGNAVKWLFYHPKERARMGEQAREAVMVRFSVERTVSGLHEVYARVLKKDKKLHDFSAVFGNSPSEYFLSCLPPDIKRKFMKKDTACDFSDWPLILKERSKSSLPQFARYYPKDRWLGLWCEEMREAESKSNFCRSECAV